MFEFYKCSYIDYNKVWLRERIQNFIAFHYNTKWTLQQFVEEFISLYDEENREQVIELFRKFLK